MLFILKLYKKFIRKSNASNKNNESSLFFVQQFFQAPSSCILLSKCDSSKKRAYK